MQAPPGSSPSQNDWPKTTWKLNPRLWAKWQSSSPGYPTLLLSAQVPSSNSLLLCQHMSPQTILFWVLGKSPLLGPWRGPLFLQQLVSMKGLPFLLWLICGLLRVLQNYLACLRPDPAAATGTRLSLVFSWHGQLARVPRPDKEREIFLTPFISPLFSTHPILFYFFLSPGPGHRSLVKGPQSELRTGDRSPPLGREVELLFWLSRLPVLPSLEA